MDGVAHREFRYCRVGFCVLHPVEHHACSRFVASTPQGPFAGHLPLLVAPAPFEEGLWHPLFPSFSELTIRLPDYGTVTCAFEGDLFEREDQRNWTDGSFKSYFTPMSLGYPFHAEGQSGKGHAEGSCLAVLMLRSILLAEFGP